MDTRKLRNITPDSFNERTENSHSLNAALDDGFAVTDRLDLIGKRLTLLGWDVTTSFGGSYAEVWAFAEYSTGDIRKVKFRDGGRSYDSVTSILKRLTDNGVTSNVRVVLSGEEYQYTDQDTGATNTAVRYTFLDPSESETAEPSF